MECSGEKWKITNKEKIATACGLAMTMPMFIGEYSHNLDEKGRLAIPVKFRNELTEGAVVTRGLDNCLFLYTKSEWEKLAEKLAALPISQANSRAFARLMLAGAMDVEMDKQGRAVLPEYLRQFAGLKKSVIVAGLYNRMEIWDEAKWDEYKIKTEKESGEIAERMAELGV
jgi:MraZ protein